MVDQSSETTSVSVPLAHVRPCAHNCWEDVRTRKRNKILRCMECSNKWKVSAGDISRCSSFMSTNKCPMGDKCTKLHVFKKPKPGKHPFVEDSDMGSIRGVQDKLGWSTSSDEVASVTSPFCDDEGYETDNGGVYAMTEDELDAHMRQLFGGN
eukprot:TRINITY_DN33531_c0_g1_i1.p1 TRINITY_DN33531_c0_g1~~TRINITY_DN33531_c0_g1_i1.p1  ORF type:complete len:169 (+),score=38.91 TRINITY_DN33531_c0_g1_i1:51-509(+)